MEKPKTGRFSVEFEIANNQDLTLAGSGHLDPAKVKVRYADGRRSLRSEVDEIRIYLQGREGIFTAIVEPKRESALIGAIVLEDLDFLVDCAGQRLVPRDPDYVLNEIE
jgi:hypothetical protein